jgi:hypothetical protein
MRAVRSRALSASVCLCVLAGSVCNAADLLVPAQFATIQAAIDAAQPGDVVIVSPGTYPELISFTGKAITVRSAAGAAATIIDGGGLSPVVAFTASETRDARLDGFTIRNGVSVSDFGAGIRIDSASPTIINCIIRDNTIGREVFGAGMLVRDGAPLIRDCRFENNQTNFGFGAGVAAINANARFESCTFVGNISRERAGGGMFLTGGDVTIADSRFENNTSVAASGAGFSSVGGTARVERCTFSANRTEGASGAGISAESNSSLFVSNSSFINNVAQSGSGGGIITRGSARAAVSTSSFINNTAPSGTGGAIAVRDFSRLDADSSTFRGNTASSGSGGTIAFRDNSTSLIVNCVITGGATPSGAGGALASRNQAAAAVVNSTIVSNANTAISHLSGSAISIANSIIRDNTGGSQIAGNTSLISVRYSNVSGGFTGAGNINADPLFTNAASGDFSLRAGSPCIDAGDNAAVPSEVGRDIIGALRFIDDAATPDTGLGIAPIVDIGAYEFQTCRADFNRNGSVDFFDYLDFVAAFEAEAPNADYNGNGSIDFFDYLDFVADFEIGCD